MTQISQFFNPQAAPIGSRDVLPAGWYVAVYVSGELTQVNNNGNQWIVFNMQVVDGQHVGSQIEDKVQVSGSRAGIEFGQRKLSGIAKSLGFMPQQTEQMMGQAIAVKLKLKESDGFDSSGQPYPPKNEVQEYQSVAEYRARMQKIGASAQQAAPAQYQAPQQPAYQAPAQQQPAFQQPPAQQPAAQAAPPSGTPPWMTKAA